MKHQDLSIMTNKKLVDLHNGFKPSTPLKSWKGKKSDLIAKIAILKATPRKPVKSPSKAPVAKKTAKAKKDDGPTIQSVALALLCKIDFYEDRDAGDKVKADHAKARSVGLSYPAVLAAIHKQFVDCNTSMACLRWYAAKVRVGEPGYDELRLPQRRPRPKK